MIKINFSYTDGYDQESTLTKTFTNDVLETIPDFDLLLEEFKNFLIGSGFSREIVDTISCDEQLK